LGKKPGLKLRGRKGSISRADAPLTNADMKRGGLQKRWNNQVHLVISNTSEILWELRKRMNKGQNVMGKGGRGGKT